MEDQEKVEPEIIKIQLGFAHPIYNGHETDYSTFYAIPLTEGYLMLTKPFRELPPQDCNQVEDILSSVEVWKFHAKGPPITHF